jgi:hypothetical protein
LARRSRTRLPTLVLAAALAFPLAVPARGEVTRKGDLIVSFGGSIAPRSLPRSGTTPIGVSLEGRVRTADRGVPPSLRRISLEINRSGVLYDRGLPSCSIAKLQATPTAEALAECGDARVGGGHVDGQVVIPDQAPFPFHGRVVAFNGRLRGGRPAILAHLYSPVPLSLTFVIAFRVRRISGTYGTRLLAVVPPRTRRLMHVTRLVLHLRRTYVYGGRRRSYLSAGCPAPAGFPGATFPLARASYTFDNGATLTSTLVRTCHASD